MNNIIIKRTYHKNRKTEYLCLYEGDASHWWIDDKQYAWRFTPGEALAIIFATHDDFNHTYEGETVNDDSE